MTTEKWTNGRPEQMADLWDKLNDYFEGPWHQGSGIPVDDGGRYQYCEDHYEDHDCIPDDWWRDWINYKDGQISVLVLDDGNIFAEFRTYDKGRPAHAGLGIVFKSKDPIQQAADSFHQWSAMTCKIYAKQEDLFRDVRHYMDTNTLPTYSGIGIITAINNNMNDKNPF